MVETLNPTETVTPAVAAPVAAAPNSALAAAPVEAVKPAEVAAPAPFTIKAKEGVTFTKDTADAYAAFVNDKKLDHGVAQELFDTLTPKVAESFQKQIDAAREKQAADWVAEVRKSPTADADLKEANEALGKLAGDSLNQFLKDSGLGNHPGMVAMLKAANQLMKQDKVVVGAAPGAPKDDLNDLSNAALSRALYGTKKE